jgi:hypothetical protein
LQLRSNLFERTFSEGQFFIFSKGHPLLSKSERNTFSVTVRFVCSLGGVFTLQAMVIGVGAPPKTPPTMQSDENASKKQ